MSDIEDIDQLQQQLNAHRRTLAHLLRQRASLGTDYAPPGVHNGIEDARSAIVTVRPILIQSVETA
jgi:hypothetical protein